MEVIKAGKGGPASADGRLREAVGAIVEDVRRHGDEALARYGRKFDGSPRERLRVLPEEVEAACREISEYRRSSCRQRRLFPASTAIKSIRRALRAWRQFSKNGRACVFPIRIYTSMWQAVCA